ncbi:MAG: NAD(+) diphosphatase [Deltaproteobacteria bacterium]|nr:NAD(+) diphosphatase [Deltaproteobacteria bacterium]
MSDRFRPALNPPPQEPEPGWWFIFRGYRLLVRLDRSSARVPRLFDPAELGLRVGQHLYLGRLNGRGVYAAEVKGEEGQPPPGMTFKGLRGLLGLLSEEVWSLAGRAVQIVDWHRTHRFCGRCGTPTVPHPDERSKTCPKCGLVSFPIISPAVIVAVSRGPELLLARSPHFMPEMYSVLAGFVEPGESLEETVAREIKEEVGLEVTDIKYFGSQPWPFPHSLMIGFTARHLAGEIRIDHQEIEEAAWFGPDNLPRLPSNYSIARRLIDDFFKNAKQGLAGESGRREVRG